MHRVHLVIQGRVQGVGFRYFALRRAEALHLHGWVRNLPGGEVELEAEGDRDALVRLVDAVRQGPVAAEVTDVLETWSESPPRYQRFAAR
jgi:acylphosphatase